MDEISDGALSLVVLAAGIPGAITALVVGQAAAVAVTVVALTIALWCARGRRVVQPRPSRRIDLWRS